MAISVDASISVTGHEGSVSLNTTDQASRRGMYSAHIRADRRPSTVKADRHVEQRHHGNTPRQKQSQPCGRPQLGHFLSPGLVKADSYHAMCLSLWQDLRRAQSRTSARGLCRQSTRRTSCCPAWALVSVPDSSDSVLASSSLSCLSFVVYSPNATARVYVRLCWNCARGLLEIH